MNITETKRRFSSLTIIGGINYSDTLSSYLVDNLVEEVKKVLKILKLGSCYILSSSNSIHNGVKAENLLAM